MLLGFGTDSMIVIRIDFERLRNTAAAKKLSTYKITAAYGTIPDPPF